MLKEELVPKPLFSPSATIVHDPTGVDPCYRCFPCSPPQASLITLTLCASRSPAPEAQAINSSEDSLLPRLALHRVSVFATNSSYQRLAQEDWTCAASDQLIFALTKLPLASLSHCPLHSTSQRPPRRGAPMVCHKCERRLGPSFRCAGACFCQQEILSCIAR